MRDLQVFTVRDRLSESYSPPFFSPNVVTAIREICRVASDPASQMSFSPKDYDLFLIGLFDMSTGILSDVGSHSLVDNVAQLLKENPRS